MINTKSTGTMVEQYHNTHYHALAKVETQNQNLNIPDKRKKL